MGLDRIAPRACNEKHLPATAYMQELIYMAVDSNFRRRVECAYKRGFIMIYKPSKKVYGKVQQGDVLKELTTQGSQPADRWYSPEGGDSSTVTSIQGPLTCGDRRE